MSDLSTNWNDLCGRLGVKPKQFGALLAVLVVSVGGLSLKAMSGPRKASAATAAAPVAPAAAASPRADGTAKQGSKSAAGTKAVAAAPGTRRVIECSLERVPARDPFRAWGLPEPVAATAPQTVRPSGDAEPGLLPGLPLRAVLRGELAVFGDQTVRPGDSLSLPDGSFARVRSVGDRSVTVEWSGRGIEVMFGGGNAAPTGAKAPAAGGFK